MCGFCRCQMCLHPLYCSLFPSLWFLHGCRVSIRASGLQEPEHSSLSVPPREAQPCLGRCICGLGASWGKRASPGAPACWFHSRSALLVQPDPLTLRDKHMHVTKYSRSAVSPRSYGVPVAGRASMPCSNFQREKLSNRLLWCTKTKKGSFMFTCTCFPKDTMF